MKVENYIISPTLQIYLARPEERVCCQYLASSSLELPGSASRTSAQSGINLAEDPSSHLNHWIIFKCVLKSLEKTSDSINGAGNNFNTWINGQRVRMVRWSEFFLTTFEFQFDKNLAPDTTLNMVGVRMISPGHIKRNEERLKTKNFTWKRWPSSCQKVAWHHQPQHPDWTHPWVDNGYCGWERRWNCWQEWHCY